MATSAVPHSVSSAMSALSRARGENADDISISQQSREILFCNLTDKQYEIAARIGSTSWKKMKDFVKPTANHLRQAVVERYRKILKGRRPRPHQWTSERLVQYLQHNPDDGTTVTSHSAKQLWDIAMGTQTQTPQPSVEVTDANRIRLINALFTMERNCATRGIASSRNQSHRRFGDHIDLSTATTLFNDPSW